MNHKFFAKVFFIGVMAIALRPVSIVASVSAASLAPENIKLPYEAGQRFVVTQGYNAPPTHIKKDLFAMDLSQNGCDAYGKLALAASNGQVMLAQENGYNGGYGTQVLVINENRIIARYAHLIPGTIPVSMGDGIVQGEPLGKIGDTGLVSGAACPMHPGAHIHFAMYAASANLSSLSSFLAEPISAYEGIREGKWYLSDNAIALATIPGATAIIEKAADAVIGSVASVKNNPPPLSPPQPWQLQLLPEGGVSEVAPPLFASTSELVVNPFSVASVATTTATKTTTTPAAPIVAAVFSTSTFAFDLSWNIRHSSSTSSTYQVLKSYPTDSSNTVLLGEATGTHFSYPLSGADVGTHPIFTIKPIGSVAEDFIALSTIQTVPISLPDWFMTTLLQPVDTENSNASWYSDNWYNLGNGFYGTILSLVLEGFVNNSNYFASPVSLEEYLDPDYSQLNKTFPISGDAPFTNGSRKVTIGGLNIPLQPNKYYRLKTFQGSQNRSVILAGTSATGTAMWNEFIYGTGRVEHRYSFYPYLGALMIPNYPPLAPPDPPTSITTSFDTVTPAVTLSWPAANDPDTGSSLLTYEISIATSTTAGTTPNPSQWQPVGKVFSYTTPVVFGNSYRFSVRAVDDLGNVGVPATLAWQFPASYVLLPQQLDHTARVPGGGAQKIKVPAATTVSAIRLWVEPQNGENSCCDRSYLSLRADGAGTPGDEIASTTPVTLGRLGQPGEVQYQFPLPVLISAGTYWFVFNTGPGRTNDTIVDGSSGDSYADGEWSTRPGQDAYFRIEQASGP